MFCNPLLHQAGSMAAWSSSAELQRSVSIWWHIGKQSTGEKTKAECRAVALLLWWEEGSGFSSSHMGRDTNWLSLLMAAWGASILQGWQFSTLYCVALGTLGGETSLETTEASSRSTPLACILLQPYAKGRELRIRRVTEMVMGKRFASFL